MNRAKSLAIVLSLAVFFSGCPSKSALVVAKDAAQGNLSFERGVTIAHNDGFCDDACELPLLMASKKIAQYDDAAVTAIEKQADAAGAIAQIDQAIATLDDAVTNGLLAVKNDAKRTELHAILLALRGTLVTAKALLTK